LDLTHPDSAIADMKALSHKHAKFSFPPPMEPPQTHNSNPEPYTWYFYHPNTDVESSWVSPDAISPWHGLNDQSPLVLNDIESLVFSNEFLFDQPNKTKILGDGKRAN
jgi:hypothetical protein